ncbi:hypothetical protein [Streptomyces sp. NRRL F-5135]|uniref:hypothetical protein n=1 Tax=Streptomyces sp. NRRL F-5135 TaxID=1463858 RepID=UPI0004C7447C|nr:hypothetical protein [Streptomyces sp. NRRL F-5135]
MPYEDRIIERYPTKSETGGVVAVTQSDRDGVEGKGTFWTAACTACPWSESHSQEKAAKKNGRAHANSCQETPAVFRR